MPVSELLPYYYYYYYYETPTPKHPTPNTTANAACCQPETHAMVLIHTNDELTSVHSAVKGGHKPPQIGSPDRLVEKFETQI